MTIALLRSDAEITDEDLEAGLRTLARVINKYGDGAMPIFERLEQEAERRRDRRSRVEKYLED